MRHYYFTYEEVNMFAVPTVLTLDKYCHTPGELQDGQWRLIEPVIEFRIHGKTYRVGDSMGYHGEPQPDNLNNGSNVYILRFCKVCKEKFEADGRETVCEGCVKEGHPCEFLTDDEFLEEQLNDLFKYLDAKCS